MLLNFAAFARETGCGDVSVLHRALDAAWDWLIDRAPASGELRLLAAACESQAPDTEQCQSPLVSAALDAATATSCTLDLIVNGIPDRALEVLELARDTVDHFVQEVENLTGQEHDLESRIARHPLMQAELARQAADLALLEAGTAPSSLPGSWRHPTSSSIGLT